MRRPTKRRPQPQLARNVIQGASGGLLGGALLGLTEAVYHLVAEGAPDFVSPLYGVLLYGMVGLPLGLVAGFLLTAFERFFFPVEEENAWALGFALGIAPVLTFVLRYLANKVVYLEQGVPLEGMLTVLGVGLGVPMLFALILPFPLRGGLAPLRKAKGMGISLMVLVFGTGFLAEAPLVPDPKASFGHGKAAPLPLAGKPNVLVLFVDTLRADHLQPYGSDLATPTIQGLADDGIVFEKAYAQASWTRSSGASFFSSRLPSGHNADTKAARLAPEVVTYTEVLHGAGVTTGGLVNNINLTGTFGFDQGFDSFYYESPEYRFLATESVFSLTLYKVIHKVAEKVLAGHKRVEQYYQPADVVLGDAKAFVEANEGARWSLFVHLMEPHDPYFEHPSLAGEGGDYNGKGFARAEVEHPDPADVDYLKKVYAGEVTFLDRQLAPFVAWLKESGHYENTLIIVTADHGEEFYEHGGWWHGTTLYEEQIHVPLVVKLPGNDLAGSRAPWQVRSVDVAPTITTALGLAPDPSWDGRDLIGDVRAEVARLAAPPPEVVPADVVPADAVPTDAVPTEGADAVPAPIEPVAEPVPTAPARGHALDRVVISEEDFEGNVLSAIRKDGFKLIRANEGNPRGLPSAAVFDVVVDPGEQANLLGTGKAIDGRYPEDVSGQLSGELDVVLKSAAAGSAHGGEAKMSAAECEQLKALGYLSGDEACQ